MRYLTREEFARLLEACPEALRPALVLTVHTGIRQGELLALAWPEVDLENGFASVNDPRNASPRKVPLNPTSRELLIRLKRTAKSTKVLCDGEGRPYSSRTLQWQSPGRWRRRRSRTFGSMIFGTRAPHGWPWRGFRFLRSRRFSATRTSG